MSNELAEGEFLAMPETYNRKISLFLIEPQELSRTGYRFIFDRDEKLVVVGEAEDMETAGERIDELQPDVILLRAANADIATAFIHELKERNSNAQIIALTDSLEVGLISKLVGAGASGVCSRNINVETLLIAVRSVATGGLWFGPVACSVMRAVMRGEIRLPSQAMDEDGHIGSVAAALTDRESEILKRVAQGLTNQQIAERLHLSVETVKTYIRRIMDKSAIRSRRDLVTKYRRTGMYKL